ncbi:MAG: Crp/Fnr family transcriptional regulator [Thioalkalispiraceae bacterium]|jgi:CRP-like cAMP-binding protein
MAAKTSFIALKSVIQHMVSPPENEWCHFEQHFHPRTIKAGDYFLRSGEASEYIGFINAGLVRFFYQTSRGSEFNKSFSHENQFMGAYSAFLTDSPARFNIQALEESYILVARISNIINLFDRHPCWEKLGRILAEQLYIKKEQREAEFLLDDAQTRYHTFLKQYPELEDRLTQYHIASYLGITPVALSRIRKNSQ